MGVSIDLSADASSASADATSNAEGAASMRFAWSVTNGNWSVSPSSTDATAEVDSSGWAKASSGTSLNTSQGGVGDVGVTVIVFNADGLNIDQASQSVSIGPF
jgi:hypothetical protein